MKPGKTQYTEHGTYTPTYYIRMQPSGCQQIMSTSNVLFFYQINACSEKRANTDRLRTKAISAAEIKNRDGTLDGETSFIW